VSRPLTLGEIKSKAQLRRSGVTASKPVYDILKKHLPPHAKNIAQQRFDKYFEFDISHGKDEQKIINKLLQQNVLKRKWKLENCMFCDKEYWVDHIDINKPINCPGCGNTIILNSQVTIGYELNALVHLAIREGIIPVILTANFLCNTTSKGFIWLPGVKCYSGKVKTDLDLVCICDGRLFAAECKTLNEVDGSSKTWSNIADQLGNPINLANKACFEGFVVSSLSDKYPQNFQKKLKLISKGKIKVSYLNKNDLSSGRRKIRGGDHEWPITVDDLLSQETSSKLKTKKKKGARTIHF
jgi:DNA-directed RNA polymerase subunit RPC12/RpoP